MKSSIGGVVGASEEPSAVGNIGELQAALELVAELRRQLQSVKEETAEREAEIQRLSKAEQSKAEQSSTGH